MAASSLNERPVLRPACAHFSSGPCAKRPGWSVEALAGALTGRSHRSAEGRRRLDAVITRSAALLGMPEDWKLGIVPASDTGAVEMVLWSLLGSRGVDVLSFESFSATWANDLTKQLCLDDVRVISAPYGELPQMEQVDFSRDVVLTWNGTTSGVCMPGGDAIPAERDGLVICDATSAAFVMDLPWEKLDVVTWSWQKALGGEAAHGMLALSPRAVARLEQGPPRPLPKIFRLTSGGRLIEGVFHGDTINTPSMLCVEDALDSLAWAEREGGVAGLKARSRANLAAIERWVAGSAWASFLAGDPAIRSSTSICLTIKAPWFTSLSAPDQAKAASKLAKLLEAEEVAFDIASYRDAPPGLRIWGGATVETSDIEALLPWLDWAEAQVRVEWAASLEQA